MRSIELNNVTDVVFVSDVHFGVRNATIEWNDNIRDYFYNFFIPHVKSLKKRGRKTIVVVAGDYFDSRKHIDVNVMNTACDVMERITEVSDVYMLIGNHDIYKTSELDVTSLRCLKYIKGVHIIDDVTELKISSDIKFVMIPWVGDYKSENAIITDVKENCNYIVMHTEISGMTYDNNRPIVNGVNMSVCNTCKIISGHIHKRQESSKGFYLGSPYQMDRSDIDNIKGVYTLSVVEDGHNITFKENTYSPRFVKVRYDDVSNDMQSWSDIVNNNYVDIVFTTKNIETFNVNKFVESLYGLGARRIEVIEEKINVVKDSDDIDLQDVKPEDITIDNMFNMKVENMKLDDSMWKNLTKVNEYYTKKAQEELGYK